MDIFFKIIGFAMIGVLLALILSKGSKDYSLIMAIVICSSIVMGLAVFVRPVLNLIDKLNHIVGAHGKWLATLLKAVGISIVGEICASICSDSGQGTVAKMLQHATAITILWISIPLIEALLDTIQSILEII